MTPRTIPLAVAFLSAATFLSACGDTQESRVEAGFEPDKAWISDAVLVDCDAEDVDPTGCVGPGIEKQFKALTADQVDRPWSICVTVPHLKDPAWVANNFGIISEARRLGLRVQFHDAGGYTEIVEQVKQIEDCTSDATDAIIVGAVSADALNPAIKTAVDKGIVVIDAGNGVSTPVVQGRAVLDYYEMGHAVGEKVVASELKSVALLPGPAGVGWSERSVDGFTDAIAGTDVELVDTKYGDTGKEVQLKLVEDVLTANDDIDAVVGTAVTASVAQTVIGERDLSDKVSVFSTYMIPETLDLINAGRVSCAATDQSVVMFRMAVDLAVHILQGTYPTRGFERYAPVPMTVCGSAAGQEENASTFDSTTTFAPEGWSPVAKVDPAAN